MRASICGPDLTTKDSSASRYGRTGQVGDRERFMQAFSVDGIRQVYHVAGRGPVCVAHAGGPGFHWAYLRSPELEERFTMVYLEPVGTGESGRLATADDYRLDTYVRFLAAVIDHLGQERVYLLGHS